MAESAPDFSLDLGDLDITTDDLSFEGLLEDVERVKENKVIAEILSRECDIKEYARDVDSKLRQVEIESIEDYIGESENLLKLNRDIQHCDDVLESMEDALGKFQNDLGSISTEIKQIQQQSMTLNVKLKNRKALHEKLSFFVENMAIPPSLIDTILDSEINDDFLPSLTILHRKLEFVRNSNDAKMSAAYEDVAPELSKLESRAVSKIRAFMFDQIGILRKPKTNLQIQQQNRLLPLKGYVRFLKEHSPVCYNELRASYSETVGKVFQSHFRVYIAACDGLEEKRVGAGDVIGTGEAKTGGLFSFSTSALAASMSPSSQPTRCFALGSRAEVLSQCDRSALVPHLAESKGLKFPPEQVFRSLNKLLVDSATAEYLFCSEFFQDRAAFAHTMAPALDSVVQHIEDLASGCFDPVALLLMIQINRQYQFVMQRRRVNCLEGYMDRVNLALWPRLKVVLDAQHESLRRVVARPFSDAGRAEALARKYTDLAVALTVLNRGATNQGQLQHSIERLRSTFEDVLVALSKKQKSAASSAALLVSQYHLVVTSFREAGEDTGGGVEEAGASGAAFAREMEDRFEELYSSNVSAYVEVQLSCRDELGGMVGFVKRAEGSGGKEFTVAMAAAGVEEARQVMESFKSRWRQVIEDLNRDTTAHFKVEACRKAALKALLTQLLLYYTRFVEVLKAIGAQASGILRDAVSVPSILYEVKKFK